MNATPAEFSEVMTLRNGAAASIRAIRPDDRERLQAAFHALDPESVYLRYFSYKQTLSEADLDRLCEPDFTNRVVLVVTLPAHDGEIIVAAAGYVVHDAPAGARAAEIAFTVEEDFQGQGIGSRLLVVLTEIARAAGIACFDAEVLSRNAAMLKVFDRSSLPMQAEPQADGVIRLRLTLVATASPAGASR